MYSTQAFAKSSEEAPFQKITIQRNECGDEDVEFDIKYCGLCHTDVTIAQNENFMTIYPIVPGHELSGVVTKVGANVTSFKVGDQVGVGSISESCLKCPPCLEGDEHYCQKGFTKTYNGVTRFGFIKTDSGYTYGGYSRKTTINQNFVIRIPDEYPLECAGPLFCAGVTMYAPLKRFGALNGNKHVGIIGIGGLGQIGIKLAVAMGNQVTAISSSPSKETACKELGAHSFIVSSDYKAINACANSCDVILNTISANHQCEKYLSLLKRDGSLIMLGINTEPQNIYAFMLIEPQVSIAGSSIGGVRETQECMNFCAEKGVRPKVELVNNERLDELYRLLREKNDTVKRFVLDLNACA